jgi:hypothetical protein
MKETNSKYNTKGIHTDTVEHQGNLLAKGLTYQTSSKAKGERENQLSWY